VALYLEFLLATPVVLWAARRFSSAAGVDQDLELQHVDADHARRRRRRMPIRWWRRSCRNCFPLRLQMPAGTVPVYFEAAVVIVALVFVGQVLELRARERTGDAIKALIDLAPKTARRINARWRSEYDAPLENIVEPVT
jgi:Cu+-exporting ATPase